MRGDMAMLWSILANNQINKPPQVQISTEQRPVFKSVDPDPCPDLNFGHHPCRAVRIKVKFDPCPDLNFAGSRQKSGLSCYLFVYIPGQLFPERLQRAKRSVNLNWPPMTQLLKMGMRFFRLQSPFFLLRTSKVKV
jgi:hypothetical protein